MPHHLNTRQRLCSQWQDEQGQDLAEYALLLFLIAIVAIAGMTGLGLSIGGMWGGVLADLAAAL